MRVILEKNNFIAKIDFSTSIVILSMPFRDESYVYMHCILEEMLVNLQFSR